MKFIDYNSNTFTSFSDATVENARALLSDFDKASLAEWTDERTVVNNLGEQAFRMLVDKGEDDSSAIVVFGEFGNGLGAMGAIARARLIREVVNPAATLVLQPNPSIGEDNTNFSKLERRMLRLGETLPIVDRTLVTLEGHGDPENILTYGPSQGGAVALAYGAHPSTPETATAVIEAPNVANRSLFKMATDFAGAGAKQKVNVGANFKETDRLKYELISDFSVAGLARYGIGLGKRDNLALIGIMQRATAAQQMQTILDKGGSVVHAWATGDSVSPAAGNEVIANQLVDEDRYRSFTFEDDHSITNLYLLNAALAHRALVLFKHS